MPRIILTVALALITVPAFAQPVPPARPGRGPDAGGAAPSVDSQVERLLTFDANQDGSLAKSELTDERLHALFERVDSNHDGKATKSELKQLLTKETAALASGGGRGGPMGGGPDGGPPGPGGPLRDRGEPGRPGPGDGPGGGQQRPDFPGQRPRPGQVLPAGVQERLGLSDDQRRKVNALQDIVDTQLESILTAEQKKMLSEFGPPQGGPGNFDGPPPPRGEGGPQRGQGGPPRDRQRPNPTDRPARPATEP
jgi:hypothetical protein